MKIACLANGKAALLLMFVATSLNVACATETKSVLGKSAQLTQAYTWYDGDRAQQVWLNPQVVAEFEPGPQGERSVKRAGAAARMLATKHPQSGIRLWQMSNNAEAAIGSLKASHPQGKYSAVLHDGPSNAGRMRALPGNIIVYLDPQWDEAAIHRWLTKRKLEVVKKLEIGTSVYVIKTGPGLEALDTANALYLSGEVKAAFPDWWQEVTTR